MALFFITKKNQDYSDEKLLEFFNRTGELTWASMLYERYIHLIFGVCLKYLKDRERSKDAVMQIYEKFIHELPRQTIKNPKSWFYVIAKNFCLMELRSNSTLMKRYTEYVEATFMENTSLMHPLDEADNDELNKELKWCLEQLKTIQRKCIELFYFNKKCYKEIADEMKISIKEVKSRIQNGKRNLKICIELKSTKN